MLSPADRLLIEVLMMLGFGQLGLLISSLMKTARVEAELKSVVLRLRQLEEHMK